MVKLLSTERLVFEYPGPVRAVDGIELAVESGELLAVLGPNGAGKSTLLRLLCGLLAPQQGAVRLCGTPLGELGFRQRARRLALVPQKLRSLPELTVETFVEGGRYSHRGLFGGGDGRDGEVVRQALRDCDVEGLGERMLDQISGGQAQRVLVARALAQEAELLLVDEPTSSLDPEHQIRIFELLARLTCEGRGVIVVTHDLNLASQFASRLVLLNGGRIVAEGDADSVLRREVLAPVYGDHLRFGSFPAPYGAGSRPFVVPWLVGDADPAGDPA